MSLGKYLDSARRGESNDTIVDRSGLKIKKVCAIVRREWIFEKSGRKLILKIYYDRARRNESNDISVDG